MPSQHQRQPQNQLGCLSRRRFTMAVPLLGMAAGVSSGFISSAAIASVSVSASPAPAPLRLSKALMGTQVDLVIAGEQPLGLKRLAAQQAIAKMQALEAQMSRFSNQSDVSRINSAAGTHRPVPISAEMLEVLQQARSVWAQSKGAFDPTVGALAAWRFEPEHQAMPSAGQIASALPHIDAAKLVLDEKQRTAYLSEQGMALDLGGIAKLPILGAGLKVLQEHGIEHALINGGGDVLVVGQQDQGRPWQVGVRDPRQPEKLLGVVAVEGSAVVASSGDYERYFEHDGIRLHHILDPRTGWPSTQLHGVTLVVRGAQDQAVAAVNGWGTALMVQGMQAAQRWGKEKESTIGVLAAGVDGSMWRNETMAAAYVAKTL